MSCWALLIGMGLVMLGNGLQGSLLGLRATLEGFPTATTGLVMTGYYIGFLAGSQVVPRLVRRVGHIRVFAALASLASIAVLLHTVIVGPLPWMVMRLVTGFAYAGLYVVAESWLNNVSTNRTRGQLLSLYMVIQLGAMAGGQFLLNLADPGGFVLFILISVLVSFALVPILLTVAPAPAFDAPSHVALGDLYRISPLGVVGSFGIGAAHGALFGMGAVFADRAGLTLAEISVFMALALVGGMALQWPIGRLSDRFDRRRVITVTTLGAAAVAFAATGGTGIDARALFAVSCLFGGLSLPMYSLCLAHANDRLAPEQMVAASSSLVLIIGVGACLGPIVAALAMSAAGVQGFFGWLGLVHLAIGLFAVWRMTRRATLPAEDQAPFVAVPRRATSLVATVAPTQLRAQIEREADAAEAVDAAAQTSAGS